MFPAPDLEPDHSTMRVPATIAFVPPLLLLLTERGTDLTSNSGLYSIAMVVSVMVLFTDACFRALLRLLSPWLLPQDVQWFHHSIARIAWPTLLCSAVMACLAADVLLARTQGVEQTILAERVPCRSTSRTAQLSIERAEAGDKQCFLATAAGRGTVLDLNASQRQGTAVPLHQHVPVRLQVSNSLLFGSNAYFFAPQMQGRAEARHEVNETERSSRQVPLCASSAYGCTVNQGARATWRRSSAFSSRAA